MAKGNGLLTLDVAKKLVNPKPKRVKVPAWGCDVLLRQMTIPERISFISSIQQSDKPEMLMGIERMVDLLMLTVCDQSGKRVFDEDSRETLEAMDYRGLVQVSNAAAQINALSVEEAEGNS